MAQGKGADLFAELTFVEQTAVAPETLACRRVEQPKAAASFDFGLVGRRWPKKATTVV